MAVLGGRQVDRGGREAVPEQAAPEDYDLRRNARERVRPRRCVKAGHGTLGDRHCPAHPRHRDAQRRVDLRDVQIAVRHAGPTRPMRKTAPANLDQDKHSCIPSLRP